MIEPQMMEKSILYACELDEASPKVLGDAEKVQQIFINLLANSIKFTPALGSICVSASAMDGRVAIRVTDSGPGIPPEKIESLFTPFYQFDGTWRTPAGPASGWSFASGSTAWASRLER